MAFRFFLGFHALSLLELSLLSVGSVLAWLFLPLSAAALVATCAADRWPLFLLLGVPYLVAGGLWLGGRLSSRHWQGFRYVPRYAAPVALSLAGFDLYQRLTHTAMRFHLGDFFGLQAPDFDNLLLLLLFLAGGVLFMLLPFLNTLALRQVEGELLAIRQMTGTPWKRRVGALFLALLLNLPVAWLMHALDFVTSPALLPWHFALSASCFNVLFLTSTEETDWTGYALVGYLLWIHMVPSSGAAWIWDLALGMAALLAYDVDLWLPPLLQKIRRAFGEFFWDEG
ncbi:MAG: hypothetical protein D6755_13975 [Anaerolineae bacterium]|nr:MAG: hypothetical protein D6755_13975 [Anaerolineae bacterium]